MNRRRSEWDFFFLLLKPSLVTGRFIKLAPYEALARLVEMVLTTTTTTTSPPDCTTFARVCSRRSRFTVQNLDHINGQKGRKVFRCVDELKVSL